MDGQIIVKRNAKDSVFTHLFQDRAYVLELYRALHPEATHVTEDMIEIVTLENVLVDNLYNDLGFLVDKRLIVLVEAQSTWTVNIIVRALMYLAQTYHDYIAKENLNLYGGRRLVLPKPELYVIYAGDKQLEKDVVSLSEEFFGGEQTDLEVKVRVLTDGAQGDIINQYVTFTKTLDGQVKLHGRTREAVLETLRICKDKDVLREYLSEHEQEVRNMMISLFDGEQILNAYTREKLEEGRAEGEKRNALETAKRMLQETFPVDMIARISGLSRTEIDMLKAQMAHS